MSTPARHPESWIVRIYRRDARAPARTCGTVERVGYGAERPFASLRELQRILGGAAPP